MSLITLPCIPALENGSGKDSGGPTGGGDCAGYEGGGVNAVEYSSAGSDDGHPGGSGGGGGGGDHAAGCNCTGNRSGYGGGVHRDDGGSGVWWQNW